MSRTSLQMRSYAQRLLEYEGGGDETSSKTRPAGFEVCEKLRSHLAALMGVGGVQVLLACALARASTEAPWLRSVRVKADGSLAGLEEIQAQLSQGELLEGGTVLLAQLLGLLVAFIGQSLTSRMVCDVWPDLLCDDLELGQEGDK